MRIFLIFAAVFYSATIKRNDFFKSEKKVKRKKLISLKISDDDVKKSENRKGDEQNNIMKMVKRCTRDFNVKDEHKSNDERARKQEEWSELSSFLQ